MRGVDWLACTALAWASCAAARGGAVVERGPRSERSSPLLLPTTNCTTLGCGHRNTSFSCGCNSACERYHDCCHDFNTTCAGHMPTPAPTLPDDDDAPLPPSPVGAMPEQLHLALTKMVGSAPSSLFKRVPICGLHHTRKEVPHRQPPLHWSVSPSQWERCFSSTADSFMLGRETTARLDIKLKFGAQILGPGLKLALILRTCIS